VCVVEELLEFLLVFVVLRSPVVMVCHVRLYSFVLHVTWKWLLVCVNVASRVPPGSVVSCQTTIFLLT
jgi:hypothetical protein